MSFYNLFFDVNPHSAFIAQLIGLTKIVQQPNKTGEICDYVTVNVERLRNVYTVDGKIMIYARIGGGNREAYEDHINFLRSSRFYLYDEDCAADSTYAKFFFRYPTGSEAIEELEKAQELLGLGAKEILDANKTKFTTEHLKKLLDSEAGEDPSILWKQVFDEIKQAKEENENSPSLEQLTSIDQDDINNV